LGGALIFINRKHIRAPRDLITKGSEDRKRIALLIDGNGSTLCEKDFRPDIYGSLEVKRRLWKMQHRKCCYCEQKLEPKFSTVEHFRPKTEAIRADNSHHLGCWWLVYEFLNLYFACNNCNQPKGAHFPLQTGTAPLVAGQKPWKHPESPLLLDPGHDDPENHITFVKEGPNRFMPVPQNASLRGAETIKKADLRRDDLVDLRKDYLKQHLSPVIKRFQSSKKSDDHAGMTQAKEDAKNLTKPEAAFSLMAKAVFVHYGVL
jgi:uncharacterized protein (TIGR02646 family)